MGQDWSRSWRVANPEQLVLTLGAAPFGFKGAGFDSSSNLLFPRALLGGNRGQTGRPPLFGCISNNRPRRSLLLMTIQPGISTIPCKILYLPVLSLLPFPMFASPSASPTNRSPHLLPPSSNLCHPEHREGSAFRLSLPRALSGPALSSHPSPVKFALSIEAPAPVGAVNFPSLSPFPAALTDRSQLTENPATLSPVSATLTSRVKLNPFVCHSYKNHGGWRRAIVNFFVAQTSVCALLRQSTPASSESKHPQEFKNLAVLPVTLHPLPPVTSHESPVTNH